MRTNEEILDSKIGSIRAENKDEIWYDDAIEAMQELREELLQHNVSNRREQLIAFAKWLAHEEEYGKDGSVRTVDAYLESN